MSHELYNTFTANSPEVSLTLKEWTCDGKYVITGHNADYCPNCGEGLNDD